jgi:hypothetical protein
MAGAVGSVYPSSQFGQEYERGVIPCYAGSDIVQGAAVTLASGGDWMVVMCGSQNQKPLGIARDYAIAGNAVGVFDIGNIKRTFPGAGGSFPRESYVGVVGTSSMVHPQSGVTVTYPVIGQVTGTPSIALGASTAAVWAIGQAWESAALNDQAAFRIEPALLSGVVNSN